MPSRYTLLWLDNTGLNRFVEETLVVECAGIPRTYQAFAAWLQLYLQEYLGRLSLLETGGVSLKKLMMMLRPVLVLIVCPPPPPPLLTRRALHRPVLIFKQRMIG
jgi:hypothetical protein